MNMDAIKHAHMNNNLTTAWSLQLKAVECLAEHVRDINIGVHNIHVQHIYKHWCKQHPYKHWCKQHTDNTGGTSEWLTLNVLV